MNGNIIQNRLVEFLRSQTGQETLAADSELLESGIVDSLTMMDLLVFVETEYELRLDFADINADIFRAPETLAAFIGERLAETQRQSAA